MSLVIDRCPCFRRDDNIIDYCFLRAFVVNKNPCSLYYKLPTTGNSFQIIHDAHRILFNYIGLYVSSFLCVLGALCGFLFFWFRPEAGL